MIVGKDSSITVVGGAMVRIITEHNTSETTRPSKLIAMYDMNPDSETGKPMALVRNDAVIETSAPQHW